MFFMSSRNGEPILLKFTTLRSAAKRQEVNSAALLTELLGVSAARMAVEAMELALATTTWHLPSAPANSKETPEEILLLPAAPQNHLNKLEH